VEVRPSGRAVIALLVLLVLAPGRLAARDVVMTQVTGKDTVVYRQGIRPAAQGWEATVESPLESNTVALDSARATVSWRASNPSLGMQIAAERRGESVVIAGTFRGRPYEKSFSLGGDPWYQFHELSLDGLPSSGSPFASFWTIDRRTLKPVKFKAERRGDENVAVLGQSFAAIRYDMTIAGVPPVLFRARFWLRATDGRYLRLEVAGLPGQEAASTVELTSDSGS
jgi:hypothetical protein